MFLCDLINGIGQAGLEAHLGLLISIGQTGQAWNIARDVKLQVSAQTRRGKSF